MKLIFELFSPIIYLYRRTITKQIKIEAEEQANTMDIDGTQQQQQLHKTPKDDNYERPSIVSVLSSF